MAATVDVEFETPDTVSVLYHLTMMAYACPPMFLLAARMIMQDVLTMVAQKSTGDDRIQVVFG